MGKVFLMSGVVVLSEQEIVAIAAGSNNRIKVFIIFVYYPAANLCRTIRLLKKYTFKFNNRHPLYMRGRFFIFVKTQKT